MIKKIVQTRNREPIPNVDFIDRAASTHMHHDPSFFGIRRTGIAQGPRFSLMWPFRKRFSICLPNSSYSSRLIRQCGRFGNVAPGSKSISSGKTSAKSVKTLLETGSGDEVRRRWSVVDKKPKRNL